MRIGLPFPESSMLFVSLVVLVFLFAAVVVLALIGGATLDAQQLRSRSPRIPPPWA